MEKTNVMRILDKSGIAYSAYEYDKTLTDGMSVAETLGKSPETVFKTLVTVSGDNRHFVFVIPVEKTLDLKKAARAAGVKSVSMLKQKELLPTTGYIHGGCSPIAMKKKFATVIDETALLSDAICSKNSVVFFQDLSEFPWLRDQNFRSFTLPYLSF